MAEYPSARASWVVGHGTAALHQQCAHLSTGFGCFFLREEDVANSAFTRAALLCRLEAVGPGAREGASEPPSRLTVDEMRAAGGTEGTKDEREDGAAAVLRQRQQHQGWLSDLRARCLRQGSPACAFQRRACEGETTPFTVQASCIEDGLQVPGVMLPVCFLARRIQRSSV